MDKFVKTLIDISQKTLQGLREDVDTDKILKLVNEIKILFQDDRYNNDSIKDCKKDYPEEIIKLKETLLNYIGEKDLKTLKTKCSDSKWKYLTKRLAYPYELFNSLDDYKKPVNNLKKEDFFSKLKTKCPDDREIELTKDIIKFLNIKSGKRTNSTISRKSCFVYLHVCLRNS